MVSWDTIIQILIAGAPLEAAALVWLWHFIGSRMPQARFALLEKFAPVAVHEIEQCYGNQISNEQKKAKAIEAIHNLFVAANRQPPSDTAIESFIESSVWLSKWIQGKFGTDAGTRRASGGPPYGINLPQRNLGSNPQ